MCWYFGQIEPWQILRNKQTIRDSWLGLVIVPSVYHCQGPQKTLFLLWVWGLKAKHCHWITAPPCSAWRKSFLCRLCWAWACVALGWNVYIAMHASWCSPTCVGHACGKPWSLERRHWTSLCSCGLKGANSFACTKDSKMYMWCNDSNWVLYDPRTGFKGKDGPSWASVQKCCFGKSHGLTS